MTMSFSAPWKASTVQTYTRIRSDVSAREAHQVVRVCLLRNVRWPKLFPKEAFSARTTAVLILACSTSNSSDRQTDRQTESTHWLNLVHHGEGLWRSPPFVHILTT